MTQYKTRVTYLDPSVTTFAYVGNIQSRSYQITFCLYPCIYI